MQIAVHCANRDLLDWLPLCSRYTVYQLTAVPAEVPHRHDASIACWLVTNPKISEFL